MDSQLAPYNMMVWLGPKLFNVLVLKFYCSEVLLGVKEELLLFVISDNDSVCQTVSV